MKALVTGSAGFIGRHVSAELLARGWDVTAVDIRAAAFGWQSDMLTWLHGDSTAYDLVVHAAASAPHRVAIDTQPASHVYNRLLDAALFDWAIRAQPGRVLYLSSCAVLDDQPDAYGRYKLAGEQLVGHARECGVPVTVVRPFSGYGEDQGEDWPFGAFVTRARRREDPFTIWGDGSQVRDWIHVDDVVAGAVAVVESGTEEPVSLCTGVGTSMLDLARLVCAEAGYAPEFELRLDKPAGRSYRVGDPAVLGQWYVPQMPVEEGVKRALAQAEVIE